MKRLAADLPLDSARLQVFVVRDRKWQAKRNHCSLDMRGSRAGGIFRFRVTVTQISVIAMQRDKFAR